MLIVEEEFRNSPRTAKEGGGDSSINNEKTYFVEASSCQPEDRISLAKLSLLRYHSVFLLHLHLHLLSCHYPHSR